MKKLIITSLLLSSMFITTARAVEAIPDEDVVVVLPDTKIVQLEAPKVKSNEDLIVEFLVDEVGLNEAASCAILGVMSLENSLFEPDLLQYGKTQRDLTKGNDAGYGILQWTNTRRYGAWRYNDLVNYCATNGYDHKTLDGQLHFLKWELEERTYFVNLKVLDKLKDTPNTAQGAYSAVSKFMRNFMGSTSGTYKRAVNARDMYWPMYGKDD